MTINLANNNPRIEYTVAQGVVQTVFTVPFEYFEDADVSIYVDGVKKSLGADYTLSGGDGSTGVLTFVAGSPQQITGGVGGSEVSIVRDVALERTTDFASSGYINRVALNTQLDTIVAQVADLDDRVSRSIHLNDSVVGPDMLLTDDRKGKIISFNATTGAVETNKTIADFDIAVTAVTVATAQAVIATDEATASAASAALAASVVIAKKEYATVALLLADTTDGTFFNTGDYVTVIEGGFSYKVATSGDVTNAGGIQFSVLPNNGAVSDLQFGAVRDGVTDDTAARTAAQVYSAANDLIFEAGKSATTLTNYTSVTGAYSGSNSKGAEDASSRTLSSNYNHVTTPLDPVTGSGALNWFQANEWATPNRHFVYLDGANIAGQPSATYTGNDAVSAFHIGMRSTAGHDEDRAQGTVNSYNGRTKIQALKIDGQQDGNGDFPLISAEMLVNAGSGPTPLSTISTPAGAILQGKVTAGAPNVHMLFGEIHVEDNGHASTRGEGPSILLTRDAADTNNMETWWDGFRLSSRGTVAVDVGFNMLSSVGKPGYDVGFNFSGGAFTMAAIALAEDHVLEFKATTGVNATTNQKQKVTAVDGWSWEYSTTQVGMVMKVANDRALTATATDFTIGVLADDSGKVRVPSDTYNHGLQFGGIGTTQYIGAYGSSTDATEIKVQTRDGATLSTVATFESGGDLNLATGGKYQIGNVSVVRERSATALSADATDLASAITLINELKSLVKDYHKLSL